MLLLVKSQMHLLRQTPGMSQQAQKKTFSRDASFVLGLVPGGGVRWQRSDRIFEQDCGSASLGPATPSQLPSLPAVRQTAARS
mmetsp:Transcript_145143/g.253309  ORF Transcript_145143/g.253309 Transcript_145143/m.253309 type:complete len:83 (-) Transcript_145143:43-291(-)